MLFGKDVEDTYAMLQKRVKIIKEEEKQERETIQLVASDPSQTITFEVPNGPPPEELELDDDLKHLDTEEVRKALQTRWDIYQSFPPKFRNALKSGSLEAVNKVLGNMDVAEAEEVVNMLNATGILNFADNGAVRDMTGRVPDVAAAA